MPRRKKPKAHKKIMGATGAGKSTYVRSLIKDMAETNKPFGVIDPTGKTYAELQRILKKRRKRQR